MQTEARRPRIRNRASDSGAPCTASRRCTQSVVMTPATEFIEESRLLMAAARTPASTIPPQPGGKWVSANRGTMLSASDPAARLAPAGCTLSAQRA
eukprot:2040017-Prymnesium_polylepis.1